MTFVWLGWLVLSSWCGSSARQAHGAGCARPWTSGACCLEVAVPGTVIVVLSFLCVLNLLFNGFGSGLRFQNDKFKIPCFIVLNSSTLGLVDVAHGHVVASCCSSWASSSSFLDKLYLSPSMSLTLMVIRAIAVVKSQSISCDARVRACSTCACLAMRGATLHIPSATFQSLT